MSTTSTVTASVGHDCTQGNETELLNHMCILVLAKGNGTLFNATFIQEEDIVNSVLKWDRHTQRYASVFGNAISHFVFIW